MLLEPQQLIHYSFVAAGILIIIGLGISAYFIIRKSLTALLKRDYISEPIRIILQGIIRWIIIIFVIILILQQLGVNVASIWATLLTIIAMVAVGFIAVWSILSNILCSVFLILFHPFGIGDEIEIIEATGGNGLRGKVVNFNILFTFIREKNKDNNGEVQVQVPNNIFFQKTIRLIKGSESQSLTNHLFKQPIHEDDKEDKK